MSDAEIRQIIRETVNQTVNKIKQERINFENSEMQYRIIGDRLSTYFQAVGEDEKLEKALDKITGDRYFEVLPDFYGKRLSIKEIAKKRHSDIRTIHRQKKRLCLILAKELNDN